MFQETLWFLQGNWEQILITLVAAVTLAEAIVRLTPTKTDDGFVTRVGEMIDKLCDWLGFPNLKRKNPDGTPKK